jgi:peptide-methionine (R)-S-oxide reductase
VCAVADDASGAGAIDGDATAPHIADSPRQETTMAARAESTTFPVTKTDAEWRSLLTPEQYRVLRGHGTEHPGSCALNFEKRAGTFSCAGCGQDLFVADKKFESGTGWPSFDQPLPGAVGTTTDRSLWMVRTEVHCARCGGHLGHVFPDGPPPTGLRYCINGVAMNFTPKG